MTSSTVQSSLLSGCLVYASPTDVTVDVIPVTSVQGVSQLTSSFRVPYTYESSGVPAISDGVPCTAELNGNVASPHDIVQLSSQLGVLCRVDEDRTTTDPWTEMAAQSTTMHGHPAWPAASPVSATHQILQLVPESVNASDDNPLLLAAGSTGRMFVDLETSEELFASSYAPPVTYAAYPQFPPTPPESQSSSPGVEPPFTAPLAPPPYPDQPSTGAATRRTRRRGPSLRPTHRVWFGTDASIAPPLTPVTKQPRQTHPFCTTLKYNRENYRPDSEERRDYYCSYPGMRYT